MSDAIVKPESKSWVQSFVERAHGTVAQAPVGSPVSYVREAGSTAGAMVEASIVGGTLGAAHAKFGLDSPIGAIDLWLAALGAAFGIGASKYSPFWAGVGRRMGQDAFATFTFRKAYELVKGQPLTGSVQRVAAPKPGTGPGINGEDPIERAVRGL